MRKGRGDSCTGQTWLRKSARTWSTKGGQGSFAQKPPVNASVFSSRIWVSITHLEGMLTQNAAPHPKTLIQQVWCGAQHAAFPIEFPGDAGLGTSLLRTMTSFFSQVAISRLSLRISLLN